MSDVEPARDPVRGAPPPPPGDGHEAEGAVSVQKASRSAMWAGLTQVLSKGSVVVSTLVLARLLAPEDFGLFAVGMLVINYADRVKDLGVSAALVYRREPWHVLAGTGLSLALLSSGLLALGTFLLAPLAADFFGDDEARDLIRVLAVALLLTALSVVPDSQMRRALDFRRRMIPETAVAVVKGVVSVGLAVAGVGVWSLVWGQVAGVLAQMVLYWWLSDWSPRLGWDPVIARKLLAYGVPMSVIAVFAMVQENLDYLVIGRRLGTEQLGYYTMAFRIPELTVLAVCLVASQVLFPILSRLQDDIETLGRTYMATARFITTVTTALTVLLATSAGDVVSIAYGPGWEQSVPALRFIALFMLVYALGFHTGEVFKATGRPGLLNWFALLKLSLLAPTLWVLAADSISAVAFGMFAVHVLTATAELVVVSRMLRRPLRQVAGTLVPGLVGGAALAVTVLLLALAMGDLAPWARLALSWLGGLVVWLVVVRLVAPDVVRRALDLVEPLLPGRLRTLLGRLV